MKHTAGVAWVDGILVRPQHLEQQERALYTAITNNLQYVSNFFWGIEQCDVKEDLLQHNKIHFSTLSGCFQDGTMFNLTAYMLARLALDVHQPVANELVYLCLPLNDYVSEDYDAERRFYVDEMPAINTLEPNELPTPILIRQLNIILLTESDNRSHYLSLPVLKIKKADSDAGIELDSSFIPPTLNVQTNSILKDGLANILLLLKRKQQQLSDIITAPLQTRDLSATTDIYLLQLINRSIAELKQQSVLAFLPPYDLYVGYQRLLAELGTFYSKNRQAIEIITYVHDDLTTCFQMAKNKLIEVLEVKFEHQAKQIKLAYEDSGIYRAQGIDSELLTNHRWIVEIRNPDVTQRQRAIKQLKIASHSQISRIIHFQLPGILTETLAVVPPQLPYFDDATYLMINKQGENWQQLLKEGTLSLYLAHEKHSTIQLWAIPELSTTTTIMGSDDESQK